MLYVLYCRQKGSKQSAAVGDTAEGSAATAWLGKVIICVAGTHIRARKQLGRVQCIVHIELVRALVKTLGHSLSKAGAGHVVCAQPQEKKV